MYEDGEFAVSVPQAASAFDVLQNHASRDFKALLGNGLTFSKTKIDGTRITTSAITLKNFHPVFTSWLKLDNIDGRKYGYEVNRLKACASLPLILITEYSSDQMRKLNTVETEYNVLRKIGKDHKEALAIL